MAKLVQFRRKGPLCTAYFPESQAQATKTCGSLVAGTAAVRLWNIGTAAGGPTTRFHIQNTRPYSRFRSHPLPTCGSLAITELIPNRARCIRISPTGMVQRGRLTADHRSGAIRGIFQGCINQPPAFGPRASPTSTIHRLSPKRLQPLLIAD